MPKPFTMPAFIELRATSETPGGSFSTLETVLRSPRLQGLVLDKRGFGRLLRELRKRNRLVEIPYIGPKDRM
jgi:hypothetical protein